MALAFNAINNAVGYVKKQRAAKETVAGGSDAQMRVFSWYEL
jgi:hypothetical protein